MPNFRERERALYRALRFKISLDLEFSEDQFEKWDIISHEKELFGELKCRDAKYKRSYEDFLIERNKWEALMQKARETGYRPLYINEHEGDVWVYALDMVQEPEWKTLRCNAHTHFHAKGGERIEKQVGFLKWGQCQRFYKGFLKV